jgi:asparagine synthase (glutamine-hydrolysing)
MCDVIRHRGPDDEGLFVDKNFGMGMRRLSIIDLSTGHQPLANEDGTVWVVFNGEIYNFQELRDRLRVEGHAFRTQSDTEVIVHLYEEKGEAFVKHLRGMFAIALWDGKKRKLILARDRLGIKPLYYYSDGRSLLFGSELKSLLAAGMKREIDPQALHDYFSLGYVPAPETIFQGARKLLPGHLLVRADGRTRIEKYWEVGLPANGRGAEKAVDYAEELYELLKESVRIHLVSDVPLGVFLSGGIDSSAVVALMREVSTAKIKTFTVGFAEKSYTELEEAREVAKRFETDHHEVVVTAKATEVVQDLVRFFDEPFGDSSALAVFYLSRLARESVKVALSGEGGDEVFGGYETYSAYKWANLYKAMPGALSERILPFIVDHLPVSHRKISFDYKAKRFVRGALLPPALGHFWWKVIFSEETKKLLYQGPLDSVGDTARISQGYFDACQTEDTLNRLLYVDLKLGLPDDMLVKVDRMSMATSLEVRVPLLDHKVVEFMGALPASLKMRGWQKKYLLKKSMSGRLPDKILGGKKRGFNVPVPIWLMGELRDMVHDTLAPGRVRDNGILDPDYISQMIRDHEGKRQDYSRNIWILLVFQLWYETYMKAEQKQEFASRCLPSDSFASPTA